MKIIVALGNPGPKYKDTRHNVGFMAVDFILRADEFFQAKPSHEFLSEINTWGEDGNKVIFLKPQTYVNDSGQALNAVLNFYKTKPGGGSIDVAKDLLVIHDDVDLPLGEIRPTESSSAAGHNGVKDIIEKLGTQDFHRIRIGVESRAAKDEIPTDAFVLQNFSDDELKKLQTDVFPNIMAEVQKFIAF